MTKAHDGNRVLAVLALVAATACGSNGDPTGSKQSTCDPIPAAAPEITVSGDTRYVHDPEIVQEGDSYYVLSTNDGIPIRRSADLLSWTMVGRVFPNQLPPWATSEVPGVQAPWAPGVGFFNDRFYLYYSLSTFGSPRSVIGLAKNLTLDPTSPDYLWEDDGKVVESFAGSEFNAIDPAVIQDTQGGIWLTWGSWGGGIKMHALDPRTGMLSQQNDTLYSLARRPIEQAVEGPYIVRRGSHYYLFVSFDLCCRGVESTYNVRVGRSVEVTGPYVDRDGTPMMEGGGSLVLDSYGRIRGPGHASVLATGSGFLLVHHFYDANDDGVAHLQIRPLLWDDEGWPLAGPPYDGTAPGPPPSNPDLTGRWSYHAGDEALYDMELRLDGSIASCTGSATWSYDAPMVTIRWTTAPDGPGRTDRGVLSADGNSIVGRTPDGRIVRAYRPAGGG